jgi:uncharacterized caspase-like protein
MAQGTVAQAGPSQPVAAQPTSPVASPAAAQGIAAGLQAGGFVFPEKRIALVVGNARYAAKPLDNPENDAQLIAASLRQLGFEVATHLNLNVREFRRVLREFSRRIQEEDAVAVLFYAGHGVQIDGRNYLLPVDVNLRDEEEVKDESVDIEDVFLSRLDRARAPVRILILDACRDDPFRTKTRNIRASGGLAEMNARGALIAYAAAPGATAEDGPDGTNSVYTKHLATEIFAEGVEVEQMFKNVRVKVLRDTNQRQVPWVNTSLTVNFSFNPGAGPAVSREDLAGAEENRRLQGELDQSLADRKRLEDEIRRLEAERDLARREFERVNAAARPTVDAAATKATSERLEESLNQKLLERTRVETELEQRRRAVEQAIDASRKAGGSASAGSRRPEPQPAPERPVARSRASAARCADLLQRVTLGDSLSPDEKAFIEKECR